ncbi:DUF748 domain-containing protein [Herbaspirillum sp. HC18]|nr:DUF748 domain-containing protein [Herbaspirillum sp. HC18]
MSSPIRTKLSALIHGSAARRAAKGLFAAVMLYGVIGFFILPGIIQSRLETLIAEKLHRQASIGAVEVNPYSLTLTLRDLKMLEPEGNAVFASFDALYVDLSSQSLLRLAPVVREVSLFNPYLHLVRVKPRGYSFDDIIELLASQPSSREPARFSVNNIRLQGGRIDFDDRPAKTAHKITDITLGIPFLSSLPSQVDIFVEPLLKANVNGSPLELKGKARPFADPADAVLELKLDGQDLTRYIEYLPLRPHVRVAGAKLDLDMTAQFRQGGDAQALLLRGKAALKSLQVADPDGKPVLGLRELAVDLREADVFGGRVDVARIVLDGLRADVSRAEDGTLSVNRLLPLSSAADAQSAKRDEKPAGINVAIGEIAVRDATLRYADEHAAQPMRASVEKLDTTVRKLSFDMRKGALRIDEVASGNADVMLNRNFPPKTASAPAEAARPEAASDAGYAVSIGKAGVSNWSVRVEDRGAAEPVVTTVAPLNLAVHDISTAPASRARLDLKASVNKTGRMSADGTVGIAPLHADLALDISGVDILPLQSFVADKINFHMTHADLSANGRVKLDAAKDGTLQGGYKGSATLGNLAAVDHEGKNDFLRWKSLHAGGMDVRLAPFAVTMEEVALSDFFARVIIDPTGRINLQDIVRSEPAKPAATGTARQTEKTSAPPVTIKRVTLQGGRVRFTDNFIRPNYSASLSQFGGVVTGLSSDPAARADVDLRGEVNGAPLSVGGRINPLRGDLFLDIKANVRGMELAPLSAYSRKYAGYGIERGRLSFEVSYQVDKRKLNAENRLILEQLTFGDKVDTPGATTLPVQFAAALLADRNGVIDVNLPISGSLDDPQFSLGAVIAKVIGNMIVKAVTQPFALLGSLFGGGAELSSMAFEPGRATVPAAGEEKLRSLAKALTERPGLKLDIGGRADPEADREGLKHVYIERKVRSLKMRDLREKGVDVEPGSVTVSREEYPGLLQRAYRDEKFPKPRNVLGLTKSLPVEEMEKLMMANADIDEDDLLALGNQRAQAVKNWLQKNGKVAPERLFLVAAKIGGGDKEKGGPPSRVDFALR